MKCLVVFALVFFVSVAARKTATNTRLVYNDWRSCMVDKLPEETRGAYNTCHDRARGTQHHNFREGLQCVLGHYNLVQGTRVNLQAMRQAAASVQKPDLKAAFNTCPQAENNVQVARAVQCVITHLERTCPVPAAAGRQ
ncbi:uncharacterized protein LOC135401001 [Ornithodoros turicata]|uniref:uncharacterized protein LOC135401001 n=1 Tax=Ornithodoros turicata TaxID=34597 RepID=UPI0031387650